MSGLPARLTAVALVVVGVLLRLAPHPWNMTPVGASALFAGAHLPLPMALVVPTATLAISDVVIGVHSLWWVTWGTCTLGALLGRLLRARCGVAWIGAMAVTSSMLFFVTTNLAVWAQGLLYPRTLDGLATCFVAAIPFFQNSLLGDLLWTGVLFGSWAVVARRFDWPVVTGHEGTPR